MIALIGPGNARDHCCALRLAAETGNDFRFYLTGRNAIIENESWTRTCAGMPIDAVARAVADDEAALVLILDPVMLIAGVADRFRALGLSVVGPGLNSAAMEGSKADMKRILACAGVATAESMMAAGPVEAHTFLDAAWRDDRKFVLKSDQYLLDANLRTLLPDGLAAAHAGVERQVAALARAGLPPGIVIERRIDGWETSVHVLWDGHDYLLLPPVRDYKRVGDGDAGPNTHGAAALACGRGFSPDLEKRLRGDIIEPVLAAVQRLGLSYPGIVYFGVMIADGVPNVLEINVRPGNPEILALLGLLDSDLAELLDCCARGTIGAARPVWRETKFCGAVFALAPGYPETEKFDPIPIMGLDEGGRHGILLAEGVGRGCHGGYTVTSGRVVAALATADSVAAVRETVLADLATIKFDGKHHRSDLGLGIWRGLFADPPPTTGAAAS